MVQPLDPYVYANSMYGATQGGSVNLGQSSAPPGVEGPATTPGSGPRFRVPTSQEEVVDMLTKGKAGLKQFLLQPGGMFKNQDNNYRKSFGGKSSALLGGFGTLMEGRPLEAIGSTAVGVGAGQLANVATNMLTKELMRGPAPSKALGMAARLLVPGMVGMGVQQGVANMGRDQQPGTQTGSLTSGGALPLGGLFGLANVGGPLQNLELPIPGLGKVAIGENKIRAQQRAYEREQRRLDLQDNFKLLQQQSMYQQQNDLAYAREMGAINNQNNLNYLKATAPILRDQQALEAANQQAYLAAQGAIHQRLAKMAGTFQIMDRGMAEAGALNRAMIENSPYKAGIMPAPQISFGN